PVGGCADSFTSAQASNGRAATVLVPLPQSTALDLRCQSADQRIARSRSDPLADPKRHPRGPSLGEVDSRFRDQSRGPERFPFGSPQACSGGTGSMMAARTIRSLASPALFAALAFSAGSAHATTFHVNGSAACSDQSPGTPAAPLCTIQAGAD